MPVMRMETAGRAAARRHFPKRRGFFFQREADERGHLFGARSGRRVSSQRVFNFQAKPARRFKMADVVGCHHQTVGETGCRQQ